MNILEMFQKRLEDFESVTKAVEGKDSDETFEWQGKTYEGVVDWVEKYSGYSLYFYQDWEYRAYRLALPGTEETKNEYMLFFDEISRIDYHYGDEIISMRYSSTSKASDILYHFYWAVASWAD